MIDEADFREIEKTVNSINSKILLIDYVLKALKEEEIPEIKISINFLQSSLNEINSKIQTDISSTNNKFQDKIQTISEKVETINLSLSSVKNNSLLKFTNDLDIKKTIALITVIISILSSAGILDLFVNSSTKVEQKNLDSKLEKLIELTK